MIWLAAIIYTEALTELIVTAEIFERPRSWLMRHSTFFQALLSCGYCVSVWVAASVAWIMPEIITNVFLDCFLKIIVLHRLSNLLHELMVRMLNRIPFLMSLEQVFSFRKPDQENDDE